MCAFLLETTGRLQQLCSKGYFTSYCLVGAKAISNFNSTSSTDANKAFTEVRIFLHIGLLMN